MRTKNKVLLVFGIIMIFLIGFIGGSAYYVLGGLNTTKIASDDESLGITKDTNTKDGIENIALFGVDDRGNTDKGRSDATMILSVNQDTGALKMVSLLRDSKVAVDGHGNTKLNHAYAYGGPELAIKTINQNFNTDIKEYVTVNFGQLADITDAVGGVNLSLTPAEVTSANSNLRMDAPDSPLLSGSGEMLLNGDQAVAFARIRKIDSDNARADRQQQVLKAIFQKIQTMPKTDYPRFIKEFLSIAETSLNYSDLFGLSPIMLNGNLAIEQYQVPDENEAPWGGTDTDGVWYWKYDLNAAANRIHTIIYGAGDASTATPN
ncbi:MAG: LCP family protein [Clostridiales bacterium]